jgi:hypothetical protein
VNSPNNNAPSVLVTTPDELAAHVAAAVERAMNEALPEAVRRATQKPYLTGEEVLELTGWSERTLASKRASRRIEYCKEGGKIVYPTAALYRLIDEGRVPMRPRTQTGPSGRA